MISSISSLAKRLGTSPEERTLFMYSRNDSSLISLSVKMKVTPFPLNKKTRAKHKIDSKWHQIRPATTLASTYQHSGVLVENFQILHQIAGVVRARQCDLKGRIAGNERSQLGQTLLARA